MLLCAHLDTVPLQAPVEPVLRDGFWENANEGILGADNKAAIAVLLALARHICREGSPVDVELLFTVGEETALAGALAFDAASLRSDFGYVFDHASPIGEVVIDSPTHYRFQADFRGAAAHAGIRPELGRSAILAAARAIASLPLGRLDEGTTVNIGTIEGGTRDERRRPKGARSSARCGRSTTSAPRRSSPRSSTASTRPRTCRTATATWMSTCSGVSRAIELSAPQPAPCESPRRRCVPAATSRPGSPAAVALTPTR